MMENKAYLLLLADEYCRDMDEWLGIYTDVEKLKQDYDKAWAELNARAKEEEPYLKVKIYEFWQDNYFSRRDCEYPREVKLEELSSEPEYFNAQIEAIGLIKDCDADVYLAYATITKRINDEMSKWPQNINWAKLKKDEQTRVEVLYRLASDSMERKGWFYEKEYESDLYAEWRKEDYSELLSRLAALSEAWKDLIEKN